MNPWLRNLLCGGGGGGGGAVLPPAGRTMLANLKSSLILDEGTGGPTWSRATKAWGFNELGYLEELASGCAFFGGARLVRNTCPSSEDFSVAAWAKNNLTVTGTNIVVSSAATILQRLYPSASMTMTAGQRQVVHARLEYINHPFVQIHLNTTFSAEYVNFDLVNGTFQVSGGTASAAMILVSPGVYDCYVYITCASSATTSSPLILFATSLASAQNAVFAGDGVKSFKLLRVMSCDVTNYDASYIPEYVSVGVVASPYFGAGIDGAKYFETDWQGAPIAAANLLKVRREAAAINNLLWSRNLAGATWTQLGSLPTPKAWVPTTIGSSVVSNGTFDTDLAGWTNNGSATASVVSGKMRIDGTAGTGGRYQDLTLAVGKTYLITGGITSISGSGTLQCVIYATAALSGAVKAQQYTASNTVAIIFTATATTQRIYCSVAASTVADFDDIAVTECSCVATTSTGLDGIANTATTLTASAADAIILQPTSGIASAARCASAYVKRRTGTGTISFTQDGGGTWTDITSQINSSTWSRVQITATLANPSVGFKISTLGDAIDVDCVQNEAGAEATSPIVTTTATITRNADSLAYQTAGNIDFTVGTAYVEFGSHASAYIGYPVSCGNAGRILYGAVGPDQVRVYDGTTVISKATTGFINGNFVKAASAWSSGNSTQKLSVDGSVTVSGAFDGSMGSGAVINIASETSSAQPVYVGPVAIYNYQMSDAELQALTT